MAVIYEDESIYIKVHESDIPWVKLYTKEPYKELSDCPTALAHQLLDVTLLIEKQMIAYYQPTKVNIASFGNLKPRVHIHIMARFENDSHYPEPMWGKKQREGSLELPPFEPFKQKIIDALQSE